MLTTHYVYRKLFPEVVITVTHLNPDTFYEIYLVITSSDSYWYRYIDTMWQEAGISEVCQDENKQKFNHSGLKTGQYWMAMPISFAGVKISSNSDSPKKDTVSNLCNNTMPFYDVI